MQRSGDFYRELRFLLVINANSLIMSCSQLLLISANSLSRLLGVQGLRAAVRLDHRAGRGEMGTPG